MLTLIFLKSLLICSQGGLLLRKIEFQHYLLDSQRCRYFLEAKCSSQLNTILLIATCIDGSDFYAPRSHIANQALSTRNQVKPVDKFFPILYFLVKTQCL